MSQPTQPPATAAVEAQLELLSKARHELRRIQWFERMPYGLWEKLNGVDAMLLDAMRAVEGHEPVKSQPSEPPAPVAVAVAPPSCPSGLEPLHRELRRCFERILAGSDDSDNPYARLMALRGAQLLKEWEKLEVVR